MKVVTASPGTGIFIRETANAYREAGLLEAFLTSFVANRDVPLYDRIRSTRLGRELGRRDIDPALLPFTRTRPLPELLRTLSARFLPAGVTDAIWHAAELSFDRWVTRQLHRDIDIVHGYEHGSLATLQRAGELGIFRVYEQPSPHHRCYTPLIAAQLAAHPVLRDGQGRLLVDQRAASRNQRRDAELALADLVLCNSSFTRGTLVQAGVPAERIRIVPLGFPAPAPIPQVDTGRLRLVFAGAARIGKGVHILLDVWREHFAHRKDLELLLVGSFDLPKSYLAAAHTNVQRIDSIPRSELLRDFCGAQVLILPTLADGFGMVITEAMSRGLCVMCTNHCAGPDLITHGVDGLIFQAGDPAAIRETIAEWSERKPEVLAMGARAAETAARYQWPDYRRALVRTVTEAYRARR